VAVIDPFVVFTPLLLLPVVLMLVFVGCEVEQSANGLPNEPELEVRFEHDLGMHRVKKIEVQIDVFTFAKDKSAAHKSLDIGDATGAAVYSISVGDIDTRAGVVRCTCRVLTSAGERVVEPSFLEKKFVDLQSPLFTLHAVEPVFPPEDPAVPTPELPFTLT
jgi:hypothetical protein